MAHPPSGRSAFPQATYRDDQFDLFEWYTPYVSCVRYFLDHSQHSGPVQAVAAFVNIQLPFQQRHHPVPSTSGAGGPPSPLAGPASPGASALPRVAGKIPFGRQPGAHVTLVPYIRRLVVTGFDMPAILHSFFGDDWRAGVGPLHEAERRNYLFAAKSETWLKVKANYDMAEGQLVPFLRPLQDVTEKEIQAAESNWSEWLAMQDWMLGPRSFEEGVKIKTEDT